jgi:hypothetical protein
MTQQSAERREIERLVKAKGHARFELFLTQREGIDLPNGMEAVSGFVLVADGRVFGFWLGWDAPDNVPALEPWYAVKDPAAKFADVTEYQRARRLLG